MPSFSRDSATIGVLASERGRAGNAARQREVAERAVERAAWLPAEDRSLIEAVLRDGRTIALVAELRGVQPRVLRRRLKVLLERVMTPAYGHVARKLSDRSSKQDWPPIRRRVAECVVLEGLSLQRTADRLGVSLWRVRTERERVLTEADAAPAIEKAVERSLGRMLREGGFEGSMEASMNGSINSSINSSINGSVPAA